MFFLVKKRFLLCHPSSCNSFNNAVFLLAASVTDTKICAVLQVEEVRRHSHCLAFSSAGPQSQTYYVSYDSYTEHLRWQRTASKVYDVLNLCVCVLKSNPWLKVDIVMVVAKNFHIFTASLSVVANHFCHIAFVRLHLRG